MQYGSQAWIVRILILGVGSFFAGLVIGGRDLASYLKARHSGVINRRGYRAIPVRRDEDGDRFGRLLANRRRGVLLGLGLTGGGALAIVVSVSMIVSFARYEN